MRPPTLPFSIVVSVASASLGIFLFAGFLYYHAGQTRQESSAPPFPPMLSLDADALTAKSAVVYDPATGRILFAKEPDTSRPLASLTKLMSASVILAGEGQLLSKPVTLTAADVATEGDAGDWNLRAGDTATLGDLLKFGLVASSNYAMAAAVGSLGTGYMSDMNRAAGALGLTHTYFLNPTGLDINSDTSGAYGSAYDVARLAAAFLKNYPQFFELTGKPSVSIEASGKTLLANATALPLLDTPGFVGAKTGYTDLAGGNLVVAFDIDIGHPLIAVVLGSTEKGRFTDMRTLIDAARAAAVASSTLL